ncbi:MULTISPECIES: O-antigen ligase family protein [Deinococcus]|uniref:O-antigen ligase family protein n=1 Tax=Deinococcus rufus TaxID=2136097 RepID=A0ABV7ZF36_9DEIO|nr:O-antigen ligase family protein [Deinococcus sp. AB2017081]WQE94031.1 hypothetical protein U2P90_11490 [Deinococcus sp. AB2017081]
MTALRTFLAALPSIPGLGVLGAVLGWVGLRALPLGVQVGLGGYVLLTVIAAATAPRPEWALIAAELHAALVLGLIGLGTRWQDEHGRALGWGLLALLGIAVAYTLATGAGRLTHPVFAATSIGLGGALAVAVAAFGGVGRVWAPVLAVSGLGAVLWSGSRGAAFALLLGLALGAAVRGRRWLLIVPVLGVVGLLLAATLGGGTVLSRLSTTQVGGRDILWSNARTVIEAHPVGGVGRWLLGSELQPLDPCRWWGELEQRGVRCQDVAGTFKPQVMSHNAALQTLGETGAIGTFAEYLLLGALAWAAWRTRRPLLIAGVAMPLGMGLADTPLLLPGPFAGVLLYVFGGAALVSAPPWTRADTGRAALLGGALLGLTLLPPLALWRTVDTRPVTVAVTSVGEDRSKRYQDIRFTLTAPPGPYQLDALACVTTCTHLRTITVQAGQPSLMQVLPPVYPVEIRLRLLAPGGVQARVLGRWAWSGQHVPPRTLGP